MIWPAGNADGFIPGAPHRGEHIGKVDNERGVNEKPEGPVGLCRAQLQAWPQKTHRQHQDTEQRTQLVDRKPQRRRSKVRNKKSFEADEKEKDNSQLEEPMALAFQHVEAGFMETLIKLLDPRIPHFREDGDDRF